MSKEYLEAFNKLMDESPEVHIKSYEIVKQALERLKAIDNVDPSETSEEPLDRANHDERIRANEKTDDELKSLQHSFFDKDIDPECVPLIITLNQLNGVKTIESCCGHLKEPFRIWFLCKDFKSLAVITRTFDARYSDGKWQLILETNDVIFEGYPTYSILLESKVAFNSWKEMFNSINMACYMLNYWNEDKFENHFKGFKEDKSE